MTTPTAATDLIELARARELAASGQGQMIREWARLSLTEVADAVGASVPSVWRWERGERQPRSDAGRRWALLMFEIRDEMRKPR